MHRNIVLLALCQALMMSATSLTMSSSALVGVRLAPTELLATFPLALAYLAVLLTLMPASLFMRRYGRRAGFVLGASVGLAAGVIAGMAIYREIFLLFCFGSFLLGIAMAFAQFYRFAAAEVATDDYRSRAISWVLAGGLIAAFTGPGIALYTRDVLPGMPFSLSFTSIAFLCAGVLLIQTVLRIPAPSEEERSGPTRPLGEIVRQPAFLVAVVGAMIAYGTMNLLMTATPLAMDHRGHHFALTASVIQWHIVGMFAPSFFTGHLIHRFGVLGIMFAGAVILLACVAISHFGTDYLHFLAGLALLGIGWNFLYVGGTTLLTETYLPAEKGKVQGLNDVLVFSAVAATAMSSGYLHHLLGWEVLNLLVVPAILLVAAGIVWLAVHRQGVRLRQLSRS